MKISIATITTPTIAPAIAPTGTLLPPLEAPVSPTAEVNVLSTIKVHMYIYSHA